MPNCRVCGRPSAICELITYHGRCENCSIDGWLKDRIIGSGNGGQLNRLARDESNGKRREKHNSRAGG